MFARATTSAHVCLRCQRRLVNTIPANSSQFKAQSASRRWQSNAVASLKEEQDYTDITDHAVQPTPTLRRLRKWHRHSSIAQLGVNSFGKPAEVLILPAHDRKIPKLSTETEKPEDSRTTLQDSLDSEKAPLDPASLHRAIEQVYNKFLEGRESSGPEITLTEFESIKNQIFKAFTLAQVQHYLIAHSPTNDSPKETRGLKRVLRNRSRLIGQIITHVWGMHVPIDAIKQRNRELSKESTFFYYVQNEGVFEHLLTDHRQPLNTIAKEKNVTIEVFRQKRRLRVSGSAHDAQLGVQAISKFVRNNLETIIVHFEPEQSVYADPSMRDAVTAFLKRVQEKYHLHIALRDSGIIIVHRNMPYAAKQAVREIRIAGESRKEKYQIHICQPHNSDQMGLARFPTPPEFASGIPHMPWNRLLATDIERSLPKSSSPEPQTPSEAATVTQNVTRFFDCGKGFSAPAIRGNLRSEVTAKIGQALFQIKFVSLAAAKKLRRPLGNANSQTIENYVDLDDSSFDSSGLENVEVSDFEALDNDTPYDLADLDQESHLSPFVETQTAQENHGELQILEDRGIGNILSLSPHTSSNLEGKVEEQKAQSANPLNPLAGPAFTCDIPFALQQLANLSPWKEPASQAQPDIINAAAQTIYRLEFTCTHIHESNTPLSFEVYASSTARGHKTDRHLLKVLRLSAIHAERSFYALCLRRQVDVKFTQQFKHDLVSPNKNRRGAHKKTWDAFKGYFASAELVDHTDWTFRPSLEVPIDFKMRDIAKKAHVAASERRENTEPELDPFVTKAVVAKDDKAYTKVEYYLRSVEVVEVDSHGIPVPTSPNGSDTAILSLDNITFSGSDVARQELRLSDRSLFSSPNLKQTDLATLVNGAMGLAEHLGSHPEKPILDTQIRSYTMSQHNWSNNPPTFKGPSPLGSKSEEGNRRNASIHDKASVLASQNTDQLDLKTRGASTTTSESTLKRKAVASPTRNKAKALVRPVGEKPSKSGTSKDGAPTGLDKSTNTTSTSRHPASQPKSGPHSEPKSGKAKPKVKAKVK